MKGQDYIGREYPLFLSVVNMCASTARHDWRLTYQREGVVDESLY